MRILMVSNGSTESDSITRLIQLMKYPPDSTVTLLGIHDNGEKNELFTAALEKIKKHLGGIFSEVKLMFIPGPAEEQIFSAVESQPYDLVVVGSLGSHRRLPAILSGSPTNRLARKLNCPLLVAKKVPEIIHKVLVGTGAEPLSLDTLRIGGKLVANLDAEIGVLHVMSQVALRPESPFDDLLDTAESAIQRKTREGQHLTLAINLLRQVGVPGPFKPQIRHGLVVNEVLAEVQAGHYDLLVIGGHYHSRRNRWMELLLEDVASQLLTKTPCSVLLV